MKKYSLVFLGIIITCSIIFLGFDYNHNLEPNHYYSVYLDDELLGTIKSKKELQKYIDNRGEFIKNKYSVDKIYEPNGLEIQKVTTYNNELLSVKEIYDKIVEKKDFTVKGYQFTLTDGDNVQKIYVLDKNVFEEAMISTIKTFTGSEKYDNFINETQKEIETTGEYTTNIYIQDDITVKEINIPVTETIYIDANELTKYLIFGTTEAQKVYTVNIGDTIEKISNNNQIGISEFLISNPEFKDENSLLFPGQEVVIGVTDPQVKVVLEETSVEDEVDKFTTIENIDATKLIGDDVVEQEGEDGLSRVTRKYKKVNGNFLYRDTEKREVLKPTVDRIITKGGKVIPHIGSLTSWGWPTDQGWVLTDDFVWRINPITGGREHHSGVDIAGLGCYRPVYAVNNGTLETKRSTYDYGNYVVINHNNGYYTLYAHMNSFESQQVGDVVQRGEVIGYIGATGYATGCHVHYEVWYGCRYCRINPMSLY